MHRKTLIFLVILLLIVFISSLGFGNSGYKVVNIKIVGNKNISASYILTAIDIKIGDYVTREKLKQELKKIMDLGYFQDVKARIYPEKSGITVVFLVKENPVIKSIVIKGSTIFSEDELKNIMILSPGQIFNKKILDRDINRITKHYQEKGYILSGIGSIKFEDGVLTITLFEGVLDRIDIIGDQKVKEWVVLRALNLKTGELFNFNKVKKGLQRVYNLGFFDDVKMKILKEDVPGKLTLEVILEEKNTGKAGVGIGYNTEQGLIGFLSYSEKNFGGNAQEITAKWEFGARTTYKLSFYDPWFLKSDNSLKFEVYDAVTNHKNYNDLGDVIGEYKEERVGGDITIGTPLSEDMKLYLTYKAENVTTTPLEGEVPDDIDGKIRSLTPVFVYDTRDNIFNPKEGTYDVFSFEYAGGFLDGDFDFIKANATLAGYFNIVKDQVLALRVMGGMSNTSLPSFEKYEIGGVNTLRGYNLGEFRGDNMLLFNLEYRIPLSSNFQGVLFVDYGSVWDYGGTLNFDDFKLGKGIGIRVDTPLGPIRLDYGMSEDRHGSFYFSIGQTF